MKPTPVILPKLILPIFTLIVFSVAACMVFPPRLNAQQTADTVIANENNQDTDVPQWLDQYIPQAALVGKDRLSFLFWDIYDAALYASGGAWQPEQPFALTIDYLMSFTAADIAQRSIDEMRSINCGNTQSYPQWRKRLESFIPDVTPGTNITGVFLDNDHAVFLHANTVIHTSEDAIFNRCFFDIWLSPKTTHPALRKALLGEH